MKTLVLVAALCGASLVMVNAVQAAPSPSQNGEVPAWDLIRHLAASKKGKRKSVPQSMRHLKLKAGGGPARVQGDCVYGNDHITHCEDCEVDWDDLVMVCIANMICYDKDKKVPCP
jgi:hypothetical protein